MYPDNVSIKSVLCANGISQTYQYRRINGAEPTQKCFTVRDSLLFIGEIEAFLPINLFFNQLRNSSNKAVLNVTLHITYVS